MPPSHIRTPLARRIAPALALAALAASLAPARAQSTQACSFPSEKPPANVHAQPNRKAKLIGVLKPGDTFTRMLNVRERGDWSYLRLTVTENGKQRLRKGWALGSEIYGGECED